MPKTKSCERCVDLKKNRFPYFILLFVIFSISITLFSYNNPMLGSLVLIIFIILLISQIVGQTYYIGTDFNGQIHIHENPIFFVFDVQSYTWVSHAQKTKQNNFERNKHLFFDGPVLYLNLSGFIKTAGMLKYANGRQEKFWQKWSKWKNGQRRFSYSLNETHDVLLPDASQRVAELRTEARENLKNLLAESRGQIAHLLDILTNNSRNISKNDQRLQTMLEKTLAALPTSL